MNTFNRDNSDIKGFNLTFVRMVKIKKDIEKILHKYLIPPNINLFKFYSRSKNDI